MYGTCARRGAGPKPAAVGAFPAKSGLRHVFTRSSDRHPGSMRGASATAAAAGAGAGIPWIFAAVAGAAGWDTRLLASARSLLLSGVQTKTDRFTRSNGGLS